MTNKEIQAEIEVIKGQIRSLIFLYKENTGSCLNSVIDSEIVPMYERVYYQVEDFQGTVLAQLPLKEVAEDWIARYHPNREMFVVKVMKPYGTHINYYMTARTCPEISEQGPTFSAG